MAKQMTFPKLRDELHDFVKNTMGGLDDLLKAETEIWGHPLFQVNLGDATDDEIKEYSKQLKAFVKDWRKGFDARVVEMEKDYDRIQKTVDLTEKEYAAPIEVSEELYDALMNTALKKISDRSQDDQMIVVMTEKGERHIPYKKYARAIEHPDLMVVYK